MKRLTLPVLLVICAGICLSVLPGVGLAQAPGAPTIDSATRTTSSIMITWSAPGSIGGSTIVAYDLRYILSDATDKTTDANWTEKPGIWTSGDLTYELTGLQSGKAYDIQIRAVNSDATDPDGDWSTTFEFATDDHSDSQTGATPLSLGGSVEGNIEDMDDADYFRISVPSNSDIWVYTSGLLDTTGDLERTDGSLIRRSYDGRLLDHPLGFSMRVLISSGGTAYVKVTSHSGKYTGAYTIHVQSVPDYQLAFETAKEIQLDSKEPGRISPLTAYRRDGTSFITLVEAEMFKFTLGADTDVWAVVAGSFDSLIKLYDSDRMHLADYDDGGWTYNSDAAMFRRNLTAGTYYLRVQGFGGADYGSYVLYLKTFEAPTSSSSSRIELTPGVPQTNSFSAATDIDYYSFHLDEESYVSIYAGSFEGVLPITISAISPTDLSDDYEISRQDFDDEELDERSIYKWGKLSAGTHTFSTSTSSDDGNYLIHVRTSKYAEAVDTCINTLTTSFSDPWFGCQWHLDNTEQFPDGAGQDINVHELWDTTTPTTMGQGIRISVVDDGIDITHEDLSSNIMSSLNRNFHETRSSIYNPVNTHGTAVAGIIAARDNSGGTRGVAPRATIFGANVLTEKWASGMSFAGAMDESASMAAISNNSWGPISNGRISSPSSAWELAIENGITNGFGGKGVLYVFAGGNGHYIGDYSTLNGFANFYGVTAVCSVNYADKRSGYSELGSNLWICGPSNDPGEIPELPAITTADVEDRYRTNFGGTSAATPIVSGVAALIRAADTSLTWRDVKLILANSARKNDPDNSNSLGGWMTGATKYGSDAETYSYNHEYGFGMVDAGAAVGLVSGWTKLPPMREREMESDDPRRSIPDANSAGVTSTLTMDPYVDFIEYVEVYVAIQHPYFGDLLIELISPSGTKSYLTIPRNVYVANPVDRWFRLGSARHLGETAKGAWTLKVSDRFSMDTGFLYDWSLKVYGHGYTPGLLTITGVTSSATALDVTWTAPVPVVGENLSAVTSYDLRYRRITTSRSGWTTVSGLGTGGMLSHSITNLSRGTEFELQVRAHNEQGPGPWSDPHRVVTLADPPTSVTVAARDEALAVTWNLATTASAGASPNSYDVRWIDSTTSDDDKAVDSNWTTQDHAWPTIYDEPRYVIRNLTNGTQYDVQIRSVNDGGDGAWSNTRTGTPEDINSDPVFPASVDYDRIVLENISGGSGIGTVMARDDESDVLSYRLGAPSNLFEITTGGQLMLKADAELDFESRTQHQVMVQVTDNLNRAKEMDTSTDDTVQVTIKVENVDEGPIITGNNAPTFKENATGNVATYTARDPEGDPITDWRLEGADAGKFEIVNRVLSFISPPNFEDQEDFDNNNDFEVTIVVESLASSLFASPLTSSYPVTVTVEDVNEPPVVTGPAGGSLDENRNITYNYSAADPEGGNITWSLTGTDRDDFTIDESGALRFASDPDYDMPTDSGRDNKYEVVVRATDDGTPALTGTRNVEVYVSNVNEAPVISGETDIDYRENSTAIVHTYRATDPEGGTVIWSLPTSDQATFTLVNGQLRFKSPPDYEEQASHTVTIQASDGTLTETLSVTINVTDLDETETLMLESNQPVQDVAYTATFEDADDVSGRSSQWARSTSRSSTYTDIDGATLDSYTPILDDVGYYLRLTVTYNDPHRDGRTLTVFSGNAVLRNRDNNRDPEFSVTETGQRSVPENSVAGTRVGARFVAEDLDNDRLTYGLSGTHAGNYRIDSSGQITVKSMATLDHEATATQFVRVEAKDDYGGDASINVTITIEDVDEPPEAVGDTTNVNEDSPTTIFVLDNDTDPEDSPLTVTRVSGTRNADLMINPDNVTPNNNIFYGPKPDFHGQDSFTYWATDGTHTVQATVIVVVEPVNDAPQFPSDPIELEVAADAEPGDDVGKPVTATDIDNVPTDLTYSMIGGFPFEIVAESGQIRVATGAPPFDPAVQDSYTITVQARDPDLADDTTDVNIKVVEQPAIAPSSGGGGGGGGGGGAPPPAPIPSAADFDYNVTRDIERLAADNDSPTGLWSDGRRMFVLDNASSGADRVFVYDLLTGERAPELELELERRNRFAHGVWSDGELLWVSDSQRDRLFVYDLETGERLEELEFELHERNRDPRGIWSDGEVVYVLDWDKEALFVYDLATGELLAEYPLHRLNKSPRGLWSDGVALWVSDDGAKRLFAYRIEERDGERVLQRYEDEEFTFRPLLKARNNHPRGIWSDGDVMWIVDEQDDRVYSYNLPDAIIAQLASLSVSGVELGVFSPGATEYVGTLTGGEPSGTVEAEPVADGAELRIEPADLDADPSNGHQVALTEGGVIAITVTSPDGSRSLVYRLGLGVAPGAAGCFAGPTGGRLRAVVFAGGGLDELDDCARAARASALFFLDDEVWLAYVPDLPEALNPDFRARFAEGLPADTPLRVVSGSAEANEPPALSGPELVEAAERSAGVVASYTSEDPEGRATFWSLAGPDAQAFSITDGALRVREPLDYERPADADGDNRYELTVLTADGVHQVGLDVALTALNLDEPGGVRLSARRPVVGVPLSAALDDADGVSEAVWSWQRSAAPQLGWTPIAGAAASRYTPTAADLGRYLRATVDYADGQGAGKRAHAASEFATRAARSANSAPAFPPGPFERSAAEHGPAGAALGPPLGAEDADGDPLTYALTPADAPFTIEVGTGQLRLAAGAELDYERRERYELTVSATDPFGAADTTAVVVQVIDRNDPPLAGNDFAATDEDAAATIDVLANDADADGDALSLSLFGAPRNGTAAVAPDGTITYTPRRDFHGLDRFGYRLIDPAGGAATAAVVVLIRAVNDPPAFSAAGALQRTLEADAQPGDPLGGPVSARDAEGDALRYALSGPDAALFAINPVSGQITLAPEAELEAERSDYELLVEASDPEGATASVELRVAVRPSLADDAADDFAWTETRDLESLHSDNDQPTGIWSDGATLWVVQHSAEGDDRVFAYALESGERRTPREFELDQDNSEPQGIWSDGASVWIADSGRDKLFAYALESGERLDAREITLAEGNAEPRGIWSDGETIYVLDDDRDALFAYDLASGAAGPEYRLHRLNKNPRGLWSDGVSLWVSDPGAKRLFAYRIGEREGEPALTRHEAEEFTHRSLFRARNNQPRGLWSDGELMFVADAEDARIYSYRLPNAIVARLASLRLSELELDPFSAERIEYEARARRHLTLTTVEAQPSRAGATVSIWPADADAEPANGHQARVRAGARITVTVESADGSRSRSYLVRIADLPPLRHCFAGLSAERLNQLTFAGGSLDELDRCARAQRLAALFHWDGQRWLHFIPALPHPFNHAFREHFAGGVPAQTKFIATSLEPEGPGPARR